jgi:hypothetical protein
MPEGRRLQVLSGCTDRVVDVGVEGRRPPWHQLAAERELDLARDPRVGAGELWFVEDGYE